MQDEVAGGQPQDVGEGQGGEPGSTWWPWPESSVDDDVTGHRDGAPGGDETLTLAEEEPAAEVVQASAPVLDEPVLEPVLEEQVVEEPAVEEPVVRNRWSRNRWSRKLSLPSRTRPLSRSRMPIPR